MNEGTAIVLIILGPMALHVLGRFLRNRQRLRLREMGHQERMLALEKGLPVPDDLAGGDYEAWLGRDVDRAATGRRVGPPRDAGRWAGDAVREHWRPALRLAHAADLERRGRVEDRGWTRHHPADGVLRHAPVCRADRAAGEIGDHASPWPGIDERDQDAADRALRALFANVPRRSSPRSSRRDARTARGARFQRARSARGSGSSFSVLLGADPGGVSNRAAADRLLREGALTPAAGATAAVTLATVLVPILLLAGLRGGLVALMRRVFALD